MNDMYTIPQSLLDKVKRLMRLEDEEFDEYLMTLVEEGKAYIKNLLYLDLEKIDNESLKIMVSFYMQYALYSKIEKDSISEDKLTFLNNYINGYNAKTEKLEKDKISKPGSGVRFI